MTAFSYLYNPLSESGFLQEASIKMPYLLCEDGHASCFPNHLASTTTAGSSLDNSSGVLVSESKVGTLCGTENTVESSLAFPGAELMSSSSLLQSTVDNSRRMDDDCSSPPPPKEAKRKRQKKLKSGLKKTESMKAASGGKNQKNTLEQPSTDYIHVRARRGQATDSHSLAERARREKISERMRLLQGLVPGCDKLTGKALMLDEIINYVQSLQNQVEFLSMKLALVNPVYCDLGAVDLDESGIQQENWNGLSAEMHLQQSNHATTTTFADLTASTFSLSDSVSSMQSTPVLFNGQLRGNPQEAVANFLWDGEEERQCLFSPVAYSDLCSF